MTETSATVIAASRVQVVRAPHQGFGVLRLGRDGGEGAAALGAALSVAVPVRPNDAVGLKPRIMATAPGEWVLIDAAPGEVEAALATCPGVLSHYADLSDARAGFLVTGEAAARLIASECPLDLAALPPDRCAQSVFAGMPILVDRRAGEDGFRLYVDVSLAAHLSAWLGAVAAEFG